MANENQGFSMNDYILEAKSNEKRERQAAFLAELQGLFDRYGAEIVVPAITQYRADAKHLNEWDGTLSGTGFMVGSSFTRIGRIVVSVDRFDTGRNNSGDVVKMCPTYGHEW